MSRTFIEILDEIQEIHEELQNKVFDVIRGDKVEVVRCRDCKYNPWERTANDGCVWDDDRANRKQLPDDFCSQGVSVEDEA